MGYIATYFALRVADIATEGLVDKQTRHAELCRVAGIDSGGKSTQKKMITDTAFFGLLEHVVREFENGYTIAVRVGSTMRCDDYGAFGLAFKTARDLSGSFQRVERYGKVVTSIANYSVTIGNQSAFMAVKKDPNSRQGLLLTNELAVAAATALCREVSSQAFSPAAIHFSHEGPPDPSFHEDYFQSPVYFDSDRNGLEISNDMLFAGNRLGDQAVSEFFDTHLETELAELVDDSRIDQRVARQVTQTLSQGVPSISDIARQLGMSSRTLQRRLADEGLVYQELVDATRRDLAVRLLAKHEYSLAEIAFLTGYAEQSTFTRAFKRWHGQTPTGFRRSLH
ncbi:MAG: AraC family transcriptional regulator ligand-binding domain-containing protein [Gammaproteobacteria bacterium]|nr:AraC family transcriptional regulator ligand-binding domain-containing protein [Gammaproteobacteria bacterium]